MIQTIHSPVFMPSGYAGRSVENPAVPLSAAAFDDDTWEAFGAGKTTSGVRVSRTKAMGYSAVWRGVSLVSNKIAALPFKVFKDVGLGKEVDRQHPAYRVLSQRPNEYMGPVVFKQTLQSHALIRGNGYAYIYRDSDARPVDLLILNPEVTWPVRRGGVLWYITEIPSGDVRDEDGKRELRRLPYTDVFHLRGLGFDGLIGYDVVRILRETLGKALATREHGTRFFSNNARPSLALEFPAGMKDTTVESVASRWGRMNQGLANAHKIGILREGVKINTFSTNARDSQLTENLTFDSIDVANIFGLPPRKLGLDQGGGYNSLFEENQSVHDDTIDPWIAKWEEEADAKLLSRKEHDNETHECRFVRNAIMRSNPEQRASYHEKMISMGAMNIDEVRLNEGLNPLPNAEGQKFFVKSGLVPIGEAGEPEEAEDPPEMPTAEKTESEAARAWLTEVVVRMARRLAKAAERKGDLAEHTHVIADAIDTPLGLFCPWGASRRYTIATKLTEYASKQAEFGPDYEQKCVDLALKTALSRDENA